MKKFVFFVLFVSFVSGVYAQTADNGDKNEVSSAEISSVKTAENSAVPKFKKGRKGECLLTPIFGWGAPGFLVGLDFMYRHYNGFALFFNNDFLFPPATNGSFGMLTEIYFGYSWKAPRFYYTMALGFTGGGAIFSENETYVNKRGRTVKQYTEESMFVMIGGIKTDFSYFFTDTVGISLSQTHGFGLHWDKWVIDREIKLYSFLLKLGISVKV